MDVVRAKIQTVEDIYPGMTERPARCSMSSIFRWTSSARRNPQPSSSPGTVHPYALRGSPRPVSLAGGTGLPACPSDYREI